MGLSDIYDRNRPRTTGTGADNNIVSLGTGLGTGSQITALSPIEKMETNAQRAERLAAVQQGQRGEEPDSFLSSVWKFGLNVFDKSGLDSALQFIDRPRKLLMLGMQDSPIFGMVTNPLAMPVGVAGFQEHGSGGADASVGYELDWDDYWDVAMGRADKVNARIVAEAGQGAADTIMGVSNDVSFSAVMDANKFFTSAWVESLPLGLEQLGGFGRFFYAFGGDMSVDPITYLTGGLGGMGRSTARQTMNSIVKGTAVRTVDDIARAGSREAAEKVVREAVASGRYNQLDELAGRRILSSWDEMDDVARKNLSWEEQIDQAAGVKREVTFQPQDFPKVEPQTVPLKKGEFVFREDGGVFEDIRNHLANVIETKHFDATDDIWNAYLGSAASNKAMYTTGGLRFGIAMATEEIPGVTKATRGLIRKGQRKITQSNTAKRMFDTDAWGRQQKRWDGLRARISQESPEAIVAAKNLGSDEFTYHAYMSAREAQPAALAALGLPEAAAVVNVSRRAETAIRNALQGQPNVDDVVMRAKRNIATGVLNPIPELGPHRLAQRAVREATEAATRTYDEMAAVLARTDPSFEKYLEAGNPYRPAVFEEDFVIVMRDIVMTQGDRLPVLKGNEARQALADSIPGVDKRSVDVVAGILGQSTDQARRTRPFGQTAEFNARQVGRTSYIFEGEGVVVFANLDALDEQVMKVFDHLVNQLGYDSKALRRLRSDKRGAFVLDPIDQITRYADDVTTAISEKVIVGESLRWRLGVPSEKSPNIDHQMAQMTEEQIFSRVRAVIDNVGDGATKAQKEAALLHVDETMFKLGNGVEIPLPKDLTNDPQFMAGIRQLKKAWDEANETVAEFPHLYELEVRKYRSQFARDGQDMTDAQVKTAVMHSMMRKMRELDAEYLVEIQSTVARHARKAAAVYESWGAGPDELPEFVEAFTAKHLGALVDFIDSYRKEYVDLFVDSGDLYAFELGGSQANTTMRNLIESGVTAQNQDVLKAAQSRATRAAAVLEEAIQEGVFENQLRNLSNDLYVAQTFARAVEHTITGKPVSATGITHVSVPIGFEAAQESVEEVATSINRLMSVFDEHEINVNWVPTHNPLMDPEKVAKQITLAERVALLDQADTAMFFYHPKFADDNFETFRLLRRIVKNDHLDAPIAKNKKNNEVMVQAWFDDEMEAIAQGVYRSRSNPGVIVVSDIPYSDVDTSEMVNALAYAVRDTHTGDGPAHLVIESPRIVRPSVRVTAESAISTKSYDVFKGPKFQALMPNMDPLERRDLINRYNARKAKPVRGPLERTERAAATVEEMGTISWAETYGMEYDLESGQWVFSRNQIDERLLPDTDRVLLLTDDQISKLDNAYPQQMHDPRYRDTKRTPIEQEVYDDSPGHFDALVADPTFDTHPPVRVNDPAKAPSDQRLDALRQHWLNRQRDYEATRPAGAPAFAETEEAWQIRRSMVEASEGQEPLKRFSAREAGAPVDDVSLAAQERVIAEKLNTLDKQLVKDLKQLGIDEISARRISSEYLAGLIDTGARALQGSKARPGSVGNILRREQAEILAGVTKGLPANREMYYPVGTVLDIPARAQQIIFENPDQIPPGFTDVDVVTSKRVDVEEGMAHGGFDTDRTKVNIPDQTTTRTEARDKVTGQTRPILETDIGSREHRLRELSDYGSIQDAEQAAERGYRGPGSFGFIDTAHRQTGGAEFKQITQHTAQGDQAQFMALVLERLFGRTRSPKDLLQDTVRFRMADTIRRGLVERTRHVWNHQELKDALIVHGIEPSQELFDKAMRVGAGEIELLADPEVSRFFALANHRMQFIDNPEEYLRTRQYLDDQFPVFDERVATKKFGDLPDVELALMLDQGREWWKSTGLKKWGDLDQYIKVLRAREKTLTAEAPTIKEAATGTYGKQREAFVGQSEQFGPIRKAKFDELIEQNKQARKELNQLELDEAPIEKYRAKEKEINALEIETDKVASDPEYWFDVEATVEQADATVSAFYKELDDVKKKLRHAMNWQSSLSDLRGEETFRSFRQLEGQIQLGEFVDDVTGVPKASVPGRKSINVTTKGDEFGQKYSAFNAEIEFDDGTRRTIEDIYQNDVKKTGKGKPPSDPTLDMEVEYAKLWRTWAEQNPDEYADLAERVIAGERLLDEFSPLGSHRASQARALTRLIWKDYGRPTYKNPVKVISGGQYGADRLGLDVGVELGLETGGTAPKGWLVQSGGAATKRSEPALETFGLVEHAKATYPPRTKQNILDADATVIYGKDVHPEGTGKGGTNLTVRMAKEADKPIIINPSAEELGEFLYLHNVKTLNVAGNRTYKGDGSDLYYGLKQFLDDGRVSRTTTGFKADLTPDSINVGRAGSRGVSDGLFGNPYATRRDWVTADRFKVKTTAEAVEKYDDYIRQRVVDDAGFADAVDSLAGKHLVCPTQRPHSPCHAEALAQLVDERTGAAVRAAAIPEKVDDGWHPTMTDVQALDDLIQERLIARQAEASTEIESFMSQIERLEQGSDAAPLLGLLDALDDAANLWDGDVSSAGLKIEALMEMIGDQKDELNELVKVSFGKDAELFVARVPNDPVPIVAVTYPTSDEVVMAAGHGSFSKHLEAMVDGELSVREAYSKGLAHVAKAYEGYQTLNARLAERAAALDATAEVARHKIALDHYALVADAVQEAIDTGSAKRLRPLVAHKNGDQWEYTKEMRALLDALDTHPHQQTFLMRFIEAGWVADLNAWPKRSSFKRWWHQERDLLGSLDWSMDFNETLLKRLMRMTEEANAVKYPVDELTTTLGLTEHLVAEMGHIEARHAVPSPDYIVSEGKLPFAQGVATEVDYRSLASASRSQGKSKVRARDASWSEHMDQLEHHLNEMYNNKGFQWLNETDRVAEQARMRDLKTLIDDLRKVREDPAGYIDEFDRGYLKAEALGIDAGLASGLSWDPNFATMLQNTVNNSGALFTPYAVSELSRTMRHIMNWWKAAATVVKPSFHIRNLIGGIANGFIAGVTHSDYLAILDDVRLFRRALKIMETVGYEDGGADVFQRYVIGAVSEQNQALFKAAWDNNVLQTSFTRAEHLYRPSARKTWKPWELNWAPFQWGGQTMETFEDVMRMATMHRHFDSAAADLATEGAKAKAFVNTVHFDYTALTPAEEKIKAFMPFYVWTRRNIPLQMRVLMQNPTYLLWYDRARSNFNDQQLATIEENDVFTRMQAQQGFIMPYRRGDDAAWARLMWDPELPQLDLDRLPLFSDGAIPVGMSALSPGAWAGFLVDNLGPAFSVPAGLKQEFEDGGTANAPAGINAIFDVLSSVPVVGALAPEGFTDPTSSIAPDLDYRIHKQYSTLFNSVLPFYQDYRAMLGIKPNNPYRASAEGWLPSDDPVGIGSFFQRLALGPLGRTIGRGAGFGWSTPTDMYFDAVDVEHQLTEREMMERFRAGEEMPVTSMPSGS